MLRGPSLTASVKTSLTSSEPSLKTNSTSIKKSLVRTFVIYVNSRHAYLAAMKKFEWRKVAALTQDGSKYSHYMSSLQDQWKMDETGIDFVLNRKFPRDTKDMSLVSYTLF